MTKNISVAALVHAQAKSRAKAASDNVVQLAESHASLHARVDDSPDPKTGVARLRVIIPGAKALEVYDLSRLLEKPKLAVMLAEGFRCWAPGVGANTRHEYRRNLNSNFADFLITVTDDVDPRHLDETFWTAMVRWLNAPRSSGEPWAAATRANIFYAVRSSIEALIGHRQYGETAAYLLDLSGLPRNLWPGRATKRAPTPVLTPTEKDQVVLACLGEIAGISQRLREREEVLAAGQERLDAARAAKLDIPYNNIGVCAALILEHFPDRLASLNDLKVIDRRLGASIQYFHKSLKVRQVLYSAFRDLVPFVILLGMRTAFNPETLLTLMWSNIKYSFDGRHVSIAGIKRRAARGQAILDNTTDIPDDDNFFEALPTEPGVIGGLADLLEILGRLTTRTRAILADRDHMDRLFIAIPAWSGSVAKGFSHEKGATADPSWRYSLDAFIKDHGLKPFTLRMLRATEGEEEFRRTGDPLAVKRRLGHKHASTVRTHYTSDWMLRDGQDRIGATQELLVRWVGTEGRADPRGRSRWEHAAATPGFLCLDPYDSPRPGQRKGHLCTAYGECPSCPLAAARPHDPQTAALYYALRKAIYGGQQGRISAEGWHGKWSEILEELNGLLALIPAEVSAQATRYCIVLKPVG